LQSLKWRKSEVQNFTEISMRGDISQGRKNQKQNVSRM
jgi:hypothetical protein